MEPMVPDEASRLLDDDILPLVAEANQLSVPSIIACFGSTPFLDGNGRVARLMSHALFKLLGVGTSLWSVARARRAMRHATRRCSRRPIGRAKVTSTGMAT